MQDELDAASEKRPARPKGLLYLVGFVLLTAAAVAIQVRLRGFEGPLSDYILVLILIIANFLLLTTVIVLTARSLWKLSTERKRGVLGAKYRTKLVTAFVLLSIIPTVLLFLIASGMFTRSIERLFSLRLENSLKDSVSMTQEYYARLQDQAISFGKRLSGQLADDRILEDSGRQEIEAYLRSKADEYLLGAVELAVRTGERMAVVTKRFPRKAFNATPQEYIDKALAGEDAFAVRSLKKQGETLTVVIPVRRPPGEEPTAVAALSVSYYIPQDLTKKTADIRGAYLEYRSALKNKEPIKLAYVLGFLSVTLALLLAAIWVSFRVSSGITVPIQKLAEGTMQVAQGNLDYRVDVKSGDEVGMLVGSFNRMTEDLKNSREQIRQEGEYKDILLSNIDTGVVSMDRTGKITTVNHAAARILGADPDDALNKRYDEAFRFVDLAPVRGLFRKLEDGQGRAEGEISVAVRGRTLTLRMRVATLRDAGGAFIGSLVMFDDLTELLRAQKAATWQDVARQIAHEVKNPLTPIKLSAERLRKKHREQAQDFGAVFDELSKTIIQEVNGLEGLLNEFSEFARMPRPNPAPGGIAPVIEGVLHLFAAGHRDIRFVTDIQPDLPEILVDQDQMKRVFVNLFKNAVEVMNGKGTVWVSASPVQAERTVRIEVADDGPGIAAADLSRIFEPTFTRKKGGGLGLAIVERIIVEHDGAIRAEQRLPHGAKFVIELPQAKRA